VTRSRIQRTLFVLAVALLTACASPPPSHLTRIWPKGHTDDPVLGLSTEEGVLVLVQPEWQVGDLFELHFPVGNSLVRDWGRLDRRNDDLAVIQPITSRLMEGRFATALPSSEEILYLAQRSAQDEPVMVEVDRWYDFKYGTFLVPPSGDAAALVSRWAGSGLYVRRGERWEIVGMLSDLTGRLDPGDRHDVGAAFIGMGEISRLLPDQVDFFGHPFRASRPDFEYGVPLQPGDIELDPRPEEDGGASP